MLPVLSRAQTRQFEAAATSAAKVPSLILMENAGIGATEVLIREVLHGATGKRVTVVCGTGNNGGDGLVIARQLMVRGARPRVVLLGDSVGTEEARANLDAWNGIGGETTRLPVGGPLEALREAMAGADAIVDAIFGIGLDRPRREGRGTVSAALTAGGSRRFAVDLPSGIDANTGESLGAAVEAHAT